MQQNIANFLLMYCSTTHPTTGYTPAKLFLGRELHTRLSLIKPDAQSNVTTAQGRQKDYHDLHAKYWEFYPGDAVLIKDSRKDKTWWPGTIVERSTPKSYVTVLSDGRVWKRHVDHLRRKELNSEELPSQTATQNDPMPLTNLEDEVDVNVTLPEDESKLADTPVVPEQTSDVTNAKKPLTYSGQQPAQMVTPKEDDKHQIPVTSPSTCQRSSRKVKPPDRLIESM